MNHPSRSFRVRIIVNAILLLFALTCIVYPWKYWTCFFRGPLRVDEKYLLESANWNVGEGQLIEYVEVAHRSVVDTNWRIEVTRNNKALYADPYFVTSVGDKLMLLHAENSGPDQTIIGPLYRFGSAIEKDLYESLMEEHPEWKGRLLPVMINGKAAFRVMGFLGLVVIIPLLLVALFNLARVFAALYLPSN